MRPLCIVWDYRSACEEKWIGGCMARIQSFPWLDGLTIGQVLTETAQRVPERAAIVFPKNDVRSTYTEFLAAVRDTARGLIALGLRPGEHVGVWATNLP